MFAREDVRDAVVHAYNFDGPGFNRRMVDDPAYKAVQDKILAFVPQESIVGLLMEHEEDYIVVQSEGLSILQHEGFWWKINRDEFEIAEDVKPSSQTLSTTLRSWLAKVSPEERKSIVNTVFNLFEKADIQDFVELLNMDAKTTAALIRALATVPKEERELAGKLIKLFIDEHVQI
jgi:hypothetical protein